MKKVSIVIPIYKGCNYIPNLIRILEDNWRFANMVEPVQIEGVLINDFPQKKIDINSIRTENISLIISENEQNFGIHFSRVQGLLRASGSYIVFLDQDDIISPVYIREQMRELKDYDAIICNGKNRNQVIYRSESELARAVNELEYRNGENRIVSPGQVLVRRDAIPEEWLEYILKRNGADDYYLWLLMFFKKRKMGIHDKVLYWHMITEENTSSDFEEMNNSVFEMATQVRRLGVLTQREEARIREGRILPQKGEEDITNEKYQKERKYKKILELWMRLRDQKISVSHFFVQKNIKTVAIYGAGILGKHLYYELQDSEIQVACFLDKNTNKAIEQKKCLAPGETMESVDAIIVTPLMEYKEIQKGLAEYYSCAIISIETVLLNADCGLMTE